MMVEPAYKLSGLLRAKRPAAVRVDGTEFPVPPNRKRWDRLEAQLSRSKWRSVQLLDEHNNVIAEVEQPDADDDDQQQLEILSASEVRLTAAEWHSLVHVRDERTQQEISGLREELDKQRQRYEGELTAQRMRYEGMLNAQAQLYEMSTRRLATLEALFAQWMENFTTDHPSELRELLEAAPEIVPQIVPLVQALKGALGG